MNFSNVGSSERVKSCIHVGTVVLLIVFMIGGMTIHAFGQDAPDLSMRCYVPDSLRFDEALEAYVPNPFIVRLSVFNKGNGEARNVTGTIILPPNVEFDPMGQPGTMTFNPSTLPKWEIGDPLPELSWRVRWTKLFRYDDIMKFRWTVTGEDTLGVPLDSVEGRCEVAVSGLMPMITMCDFMMPDSLVLNTTETDVEPNPFTVSYTLTNTSSQPGKLTRIYISFPQDGLLLSPTSPNPIVQPLDLILGKGDSATFDWLIDVQNRITRRDVRISVVAIDDEGNPHECWDRLPIANLKTAMICDLRTSEPLLKYIPALQDYDPKSFVISATLTNTGGVSLDNVTGDLKWADQSGLDLIELNPYFPDNKNPKTCSVLLQQQSVTFQWGFRIRNQNISDVSQFIEFDVSYGSDQSQTNSNKCLTYVKIESTVASGLVCDLVMPDSLGLNPTETGVEPNPFTVSYTVTNNSSQVGKIKRVYISFPPEGLALSPGSPNPISQTLNLTLDSGKSATFNWVIDVQNRITRRDVLISVVAIDDKGNQIECARRLPIANLKTALMCDIRTSEPKLIYVPALQDYDPKSFVISVTLTNSGGANLNNLIGDLKWTDPSGLDLIEMDPGFPDNSNPKTRAMLYPMQAVTFQWGFRLKNRNILAVSQFIEFDGTFGSDETATISNKCLAYVEVEPVITTGIEHSEPPMVFRLEQNHPNPFDVSTTIAYELERSTTVRLVVHDMLGRQVAILTEGKMQAGLHRAAFDGSSFPDGVYIYTLQAEGKMYSKQMVLMR